MTQFHSYCSLIWHSRPFSFFCNNGNDNACISVFVRRIYAIPFSTVRIKPFILNIRWLKFRMTADKLLCDLWEVQLWTDVHRVYRHGPYTSFYFEYMCHRHSCHHCRRRPLLTVYVFTVIPVAVEQALYSFIPVTDASLAQIRTWIEQQTVNKVATVSIPASAFSPLALLQSNMRG